MLSMPSSRSCSVGIRFGNHFDARITSRHPVVSTCQSLCSFWCLNNPQPLMAGGLPKSGTAAAFIIVGSNPGGPFVLWGVFFLSSSCSRTYTLLLSFRLGAFLTCRNNCCRAMRFCLCATVLHTRAHKLRSSLGAVTHLWAGGLRSISLSIPKPLCWGALRQDSAAFSSQQSQSLELTAIAMDIMVMH